MTNEQKIVQAMRQAHKPMSQQEIAEAAKVPRFGDDGVARIIHRLWVQKKLRMNVRHDQRSKTALWEFTGP